MPRCSPLGAQPQLHDPLPRHLLGPVPPQQDRTDIILPSPTASPHPRRTDSHQPSTDAPRTPATLPLDKPRTHSGRRKRLLLAVCAAVLLLGASGVWLDYFRTPERQRARAVQALAEGQPFRYRGDEPLTTALLWGSDPDHVGPFRWMVGKRGSAEPQSSEQGLLLRASEEAFLALPTPPGPRWRLSARLRFPADNPAPLAGLFFGLRSRDAGSAGQAMALYTFEIPRDPESSVPSSGDGATPQGRGRARVFCQLWAAKRHSTEEVGKGIEFQPPEGWHTLELEVSAEEVKITLGSNRPLVLEAAQLQQALVTLVEKPAFQQAARNLPVALDPASPVGIFLGGGGGILIRDIVLEKIATNTAGQTQHPGSGGSQAAARTRGTGDRGS
jgi:hypothetical protein